jgi:hypothetical protein
VDDDDNNNNKKKKKKKGTGHTRFVPPFWVPVSPPAIPWSLTLLLLVGVYCSPFLQIKMSHNS